MIISCSSFDISFLLALTIILVITLFILKQKLSKTAVSNLPPGPRKLPIIGNIHQMAGDQPHRRLTDLARKHGSDVMSLQLGELSHIVISTPEAAKLVMKTHDVAFASRPYLLAADVLYYGCKDIAFAPYGDHWRQMRKLCTLELLSARRVESFRRIREEEVSNLVASLTAAAGKPVDLGRMLSTVTSTITSRAAFGKAQELNDDFLMVVDNISDVLAGFSGFKAKLEKMREASDSVLDQIISEHKARRRAAVVKDGHDGKKEDLVDVLLNLQENQLDLGAPPITMEVVKAITLELFLAGIETSTTTIGWTMSEIINDPRILQMVQREVRQVFGSDGKKHFDEASLDQLNYLDMVIAESLRLHPPAPLLVPRENNTVLVGALIKILVPMSFITMEYLRQKMISCSPSFFVIPFLLTFATILVATLFILKQKLSKSAASNLPPGPWKLPIIGNIHQMAGDQPHRRLRDLAGKYGPDVMSLQLGELSYIVISTPEAAKLVMKTHDIAFASRPYLLAADILYDGCKDIAFAPYGEYWRQMRKICTLELFSAKRVQSFHRIREEEVSNLVASLARSAAAGQPVDLTRMLSAATSAITSRAAFGKAQELTDAFMMVVENISDVLAGFTISDLYPSLKFLPSLTGFKAKLEKMHKASDFVLDQIIDEHKSRRKGGDGGKEDLVDVLLNLQEKQNLGVPITMEVVKAITLEIFLAGIETSTTTIEWTMSEMMNDSRVLQKAQQEVRQIFGGDSKNHFDETGLHRLKYLDMVIDESLRLHPPVPLLAPRENRDQEVGFGSYEVPINTNVIVNAWAINRDSRYWTDAERFFPERFIECTTDYKGNYFQFIPFGAGRRMCPGVSFGLAIVKLILANLLFHFDWTLPDGQKSVNMTESFGVTLRRQHALHLIPVSHGGVP
ncbi:unnamed protein product [Linum tenue]|uniref:Cytochrome P450 n=1 Tax=Linum tenue TaxID=586396 RepID=A0AAV0M041_9ROSI|nr:unnamed protein product [Linum tenue]